MLCSTFIKRLIFNEFVIFFSTFSCICSIDWRQTMTISVVFLHHNFYILWTEIRFWFFVDENFHWRIFAVTSNWCNCVFFSSFIFFLPIHNLYRKSFELSECRDQRRINYIGYWSAVFEIIEILFITNELQSNDAAIQEMI